MRLATGGSFTNQVTVILLKLNDPRGEPTVRLATGGSFTNQVTVILLKLNGPGGTVRQS